MSAPGAPIRVLVVDDSAFARKVLREALSRAADVEVVGTARAGLHLKLQGRGEACVARLDLEPLHTPHRPAVDVLFESAALAWGPDVLAVVLTGMGNDGLAGATRVRAAGGRVLTEAASSCVVYGMPRSVDEAGLSNGQVPLEQMAEALLLRV